VARAPADGKGAQLDGQLLAKQRAQAEAQKAERSKLARMEDQKNEAAFDGAKKSVAKGDSTPPKPAPAPAAVPPAAAAPAPSRNQDDEDSLALRSPPRAPAQADEPAEELVASHTAVQRSAPSSTRKAAESPPPPASAQVRSQDAQELFMAATRARPGSPEEIEGLLRALPGLTGKYRIDALQRLCTHLQDQDDDRASYYCSTWASADPGSAVASKRAREAELRLSSRKAKAAKRASPTAADSLEEPAKAEPQKAVSY
jgi:hypothetical protein